MKNSILARENQHQLWSRYFLCGPPPTIPNTKNKPKTENTKTGNQQNRKTGKQKSRNTDTQKTENQKIRKTEKHENRKAENQENRKTGKQKTSKPQNRVAPLLFLKQFRCNLRLHNKVSSKVGAQCKCVVLTV